MPFHAQLFFCFNSSYNPPSPSSLSLKSLLHSLPINHIPNRTKVLGLPILILQIIRMLPGIDPQQRRILPHHRVLIRIRADLDLARLVIFYEPGPARALNAGEGGVEFGFEGGEVAVGGFDCGLFTRTLAPSLKLSFISLRMI
jgi:hypothetical protein